MTGVDERFAERVRALKPAPCDYPADLLRSLYDAQLGSRHADLAARWMQAQGHGFYTIGSAGHEGNAAVAAPSGRPTRRCCTIAPAPSTWPALTSAV